MPFNRGGIIGPGIDYKMINMNNILFIINIFKRFLLYNLKLKFV